VSWQRWMSLVIRDYHSPNLETEVGPPLNLGRCLRSRRNWASGSPRYGSDPELPITRSGRRESSVSGRRGWARPEVPLQDTPTEPDPAQPVTKSFYESHSAACLTRTSPWNCSASCSTTRSRRQTGHCYWTADGILLLLPAGWIEWIGSDPLSSFSVGQNHAAIRTRRPGASGGGAG
jgi:hypothetical protein